MRLGGLVLTQHRAPGSTGCWRKASKRQTRKSDSHCAGEGQRTPEPGCTRRSGSSQPSSSSGFVLCSGSGSGSMYSGERGSDHTGLGNACVPTHFRICRCVQEPVWSHLIISLSHPSLDESFLLVPIKSNHDAQHRP